MPHRYVLRSEWHIAAAPDDVYAALAVAAYPRWWHHVRGARWIDDRSGELTCRSLLPYDVTFVIEREIEDPVERVLRGRLSGDLTGASQWTVTPNRPGAVAVFDEDVVLGKLFLRTAGLLARPALRLNHGLMMRSGELGLRRVLEARA